MRLTHTMPYRFRTLEPNASLWTSIPTWTKYQIRYMRTQITPRPPVFTSLVVIILLLGSIIARVLPPPTCTMVPVNRLSLLLKQPPVPPVLTTLPPPLPHPTKALQL